MKKQFDAMGVIRKIYQLEDVFTPTSYAGLTYVKRPELTKQIHKALKMPGMQVIIYGHSGSGKSTLISNTLNELKLKYIVTNCIIDNTVDNLIENALDQINARYIGDITKRNSSSLTSKTSLYASDLASGEYGSEVKKETEFKNERIVKPQTNAQKLAHYLGSNGVIWIIEDFHKIIEQERAKLSNIMKVFVDIGNTHRKLKLIAIGAVGTAREVVNYDSELEHRVSEIHVPLLSKNEITEIVLKGESLLNVSFNHLAPNIVLFSNSIASVCHHLCFNMCHESKIFKTSRFKKITFTDESINVALVEYVKSASDSYKEMFDKAIKPQSGLILDTSSILRSICKNNHEEVSKEEILNYPGNRKKFKQDLSKYLKALTSSECGEILIFDNNSGKYRFCTPFMKAYAHMYFSTHDKAERDIKLTSKEFMELFMQMMYEKKITR